MNIQSATDEYDRQGKMHRQMNFSETISKETIAKSTAKYHLPKSKELYYFG
jgi:hypothetical protein